MDIHGGAGQVHIHVAVALNLSLVVAFTFPHAGLGVDDDLCHGEVRFCHCISPVRCSWVRAWPLDTFAKCLTHYDTFSQGPERCQWALRGGGGVAPIVCGRSPQQGSPLKMAPCTPLTLSPHYTYCYTKTRKRNLDQEKSFQGGGIKSDAIILHHRISVAAK